MFLKHVSGHMALCVLIKFKKTSLHGAQPVILSLESSVLPNYKKFFNSISQPDSCLHHLLPPPRDTQLITKLQYANTSSTTHKNKKVLFFQQFWPGELCRLIVYCMYIMCVYFAYCIIVLLQAYIDLRRIAYSHVRRSSGAYSRIFYGRTLSERPCYILPMFFSSFLWAPQLAKRLNGSSRNFHTWQILGAICEPTRSIYSWLSLNYTVGQKMTKFCIFFDPTRTFSALTPERGKISQF